MDPADAHLVARDHAIPGLAVVLDDDRLAEALDAAGPAGSAPVERITTRYVRYKPGTSLVTSTDVVRRDGTERVAVLAVARSAQAKLDKFIDGAGDASVRVDPRLLIAAVAWTGDRRLPGARDLQACVRDLDHSLVDAELTVLSHKPHRRVVLRADVDEAPRAIVKVHRPDDVGTVLPAVRWASRGAARELALPRMLGRRRSRGVVATEWIDGTPLDELADAPSDDVLGSLGRLLARLHTTPPGELEVGPPTPSSDTDVLHALHAIHPEAAARAAALLAALPPHTQPDSGPRVVHGDFSDDQVVVNDEGVRLIDLDRTGLGRPEEDLACWIAARMVVDPLDPDPDPLPAALVDAYADAGGPAALAAAWAAVPRALLRRAPDPFRFREPMWHQHVDAVVALAESVHALEVAS